MQEALLLRVKAYEKVNRLRKVSTVEIESLEYECHPPFKEYVNVQYLLMQALFGYLCIIDNIYVHYLLHILIFILAYP